MKAVRLEWVALVALSLAFACGGDDDNPAEGQCVDNLPAQCSPTFTPTFDNLYTNLFAASCGSPTTGGSCHYGPTVATAQAGLVFSEPALAYDALMGRTDGRARVIAHDPHCSVLVERLESADPTFRMPPRSPQPLDEGVRCAVRQWIANGALR